MQGCAVCLGVPRWALSADQLSCRHVATGGSACPAWQQLCCLFKSFFIRWLDACPIKAYQGGPQIAIEPQLQACGERGVCLPIALEPGARVLVVAHNAAQGRASHCRHVDPRMAGQVPPLARLKPAMCQAWL